MTRLLFVDDRSKRIHAAMEQYKDYELVLAPNFFEAMRLLSSQDFDIVSLDHDLNGCDFQDPDSPTCGMEIVRYLEKCGWPDNKRMPTFWIHSSNLFAAHLMIVHLKKIGLEAYYIPFVYAPRDTMKYDRQGLPKL